MHTHRTTPFHCACSAGIGSVLYFKEHLPNRTVAVVVVGVGVTLAVFLGRQHTDQGNSGSVGGDLLALFSGVMVSCYFMIARACHIAGRDAGMLPAAVGGQLTAAFIAACLARGDALRIDDDIFWLWTTLEGTELRMISAVYCSIP
jgi:drug/metabolite transporter (DMT)-like permease